MNTLDQLALGKLARIVEITGQDHLSQRLMEMGLLEGEVVELVGVAPFGDPLEFRVGQQLISLRRREANRVRIDSGQGQA